MIAKQIKGKDFFGVLAYNQKKVDKEQGCIIDSNISPGSVVQQTKEFNIVRQLRPNLDKVVYHTSLNLPYTDKLTDDEFGNLARDYLEGMGFVDNQYIVYKHTDQDHSHIHIVANRVKFSGDVVSDSQDYKRSETLIRELEKKFKLTQLIQKEESNVLTKGEIEKCIRTGEVPERLELQNIITETIKLNLSVNEFIEKLKEKEINVKLNKSSSGMISGISFEYKNTTYKGSKIHRNLSWNNIKHKLKHEQVRDNNPISTIDIGNRETREETNRTIRTAETYRQNDSRQPKDNLGKTEGNEIKDKPKFRFRR
jgi:hypothetical protein